MTEVEEATQEQYEQAGAHAAVWFARAEKMLLAARTAERHALEDELLDGALADAGIITRSELVDSIGQYSVRV